MTNTQKLERLKEIEKEFIKQKENLNSGIFCIREANKIGEELIGCGEEYPTEAYWDKTEKVFVKCEINNLCPTCQEAKEILARINNA